MNASRTNCFSIELARIRISNALTSAQHCSKLRSAGREVCSFRTRSRGVGRPWANLRGLATFLSCPRSGLLPSTGITRPQRYYEPIRHLPRPTPSLAGSSLAIPVPPVAAEADFPCCTPDLALACCHHYPGGTPGCVSRSLPREQRPSPLLGRVGFRIGRFEACSMFTHVAAREVR